MNLKVAELHGDIASVDEPDLGKLIERLLEDIEATSGACSEDAHGRWSAPAKQLGILQGAGHTLDRIGSALYLNLPIYLPELRTSRRIGGQQQLAAHLRDTAALCTFIAYHLNKHSD